MQVYNDTVQLYSRTVPRGRAWRASFVPAVLLYDVRLTRVEALVVTKLVACGRYRKEHRGVEEKRSAFATIALSGQLGFRDGRSTNLDGENWPTYHHQLRNLDVILRAS